MSSDMARCLVGCPAPEELAAFRLGKLPPENVEALAEHLEHCPACQGHLEAQEPDCDSLLEGLRQPLDPEPFSDEPGCDFALARVLSLGDAGDDSPAEPAGWAMGGNRHSSRLRRDGLLVGAAAGSVADQ